MRYAGLVRGTVTLWAKMPRALKEAIRECAAEHTATMSEVIVRACEDYLARVGSYVPERVTLP